MLEVARDGQIGLRSNARETVTVFEIGAGTIAANPCGESVGDAVGLLAAEGGWENRGGKCAEMGRAAAGEYGGLCPGTRGEEGREEKLEPRAASQIRLTGRTRRSGADEDVRPRSASAS